MPPDAWTLYERLGDHDRSSLPQHQRAAFAICDLRQQVSSGGFDSYFCSSGGDTAPEALAALPEALGDDWANLVREAVQALGPSYPGDPNVRAEIIDRRGLGDRLHDLDERFYDLEASVDADQRVDAYLGRGPA